MELNLDEDGSPIGDILIADRCSMIDKRSIVVHGVYDEVKVHLSLEWI